MIPTPLYVLIPTHGRAPLLGRTLASLAGCTLPESYVETVVVENGSKAGAEAICRQADPHLRVRYMHVEKANKSHALNEALKALPDEALVVYLDDDVRLDPRVLDAYARAAKGRTEGQFYGGPVEVDYEVCPIDWIQPYLPPSARGWQMEDGDEPNFLGANWAAFVGDVSKVGGFDPLRGPGTHSVGQEHEMQWRLRASGVEPVYLPDALVWHYVPKDRCSAEWLLSRSIRIGKSKGRKERQENGFSIAVLRLHVRRWIRHSLRVRRETPATSDADAFDARYHRSREAAFLRGYLGR